MIIMRNSVYLKICVYGYLAFLPYFGVPDYRNDNNFSLFIYWQQVNKIADTGC